MISVISRDMYHILWGLEDKFFFQSRCIDPQVVENVVVSFRPVNPTLSV